MTGLLQVDPCHGSVSVRVHPLQQIWGGWLECSRRKERERCVSLLRAEAGFLRVRRPSQPVASRSGPGSPESSPPRPALERGVDGDVAHGSR